MAVDFRLEGRVALVTGASRGLGWAIARAFAEQGATVALNSRSAADCESRAGELQEAGLAGEPCAFDVANLAAGKRAVAELAERHGRLDILVNNAGIIHRQALPDFADADWQRVIDVNLTAAFVLAREASRPMLQQGWGRIINIASIMALVARPTIPAYISSKHGLAGLTKALAVELGPQGVTVNAINPGYFATELNEPLMADAEFDAMVKSRTPVGRWGDPDELAGAAVYLASTSGGYVNGAMLTVDGGMTAALY
ncbi:MAG TPA: 3-oxoacyl-ACP reductase FabG [Alphaproteobacteria bacterium]|nr:3-oxoacyl-ACP reductase FabG [Alphaproteobacteria bacterium]